MELFPWLPEFLNVCEFVFPSGIAEDDELTITLGEGKALWEFPKHPIKAFRFWLVEEGSVKRTFSPIGYRAYRYFEPPLNWDASQRELLSVSIEFQGNYPRLSVENTRPTPGVLWGDLHGMAFNQRPLDDFYGYAKEVARFDFAAAMCFSYNICVGDMWKQVKETADRFTRPGEFVAVAGFECATPPDGSHRNVHFFHQEQVPPIFFEDRPPAGAPRHIARLNPDTIICQDMEHFYATVSGYGGIVTGHFHTLNYEQEILAEIWQKQEGSKNEEQRIFDLLNGGMHLGIAGGSDTHDSMPGNPEPERSCPQTAGFMAVLADEITPDAIYEAILKRRVYGTTGARIALHVDASGYPMGSVVPLVTPRTFQVRVEGTAPLVKVELVRNGLVVDEVDLSRSSWEGVLRDPLTETDNGAWYLVRVTQKDGHRVWSSPVWFEEP